MNTREAKRAVLLREWALMVQQRQESGLSTTEWCKQNGIAIDTYNYRLRQVRNAVLEYNELLPAKRDPQPADPILVKVDTNFPAEQTSALGIPSASETVPACGSAGGTSSFHLRLANAILDIPVGTRAEDIAEVLKAAGRSTVSMAAKRKRTEEDYAARVSLAHGGPEHRAKEGYPRHSAGENVLMFSTAEKSSFAAEKFKYFPILVAVSSLLSRIPKQVKRARKLLLLRSIRGKRIQRRTAAITSSA